jgi:Abi-like protein.
MKYKEYEKALSKPRLEKYKTACNGDKNKALILYRYNIKLCQKMYGVLGVLEVVLRNSINEHFKTKLSDDNWINTQATSGFLLSSQSEIFKERDKLVNGGRYTHDKLVASLSFGIWTFMFSRNCYKKSGKSLLNLFPNKTRGMNQADIYRELDSIRLFRNRIAHHEPLCFNHLGAIHVGYVQHIYVLITKYLQFMDYKTSEILFGVETPTSTIEKIKELANSI